jgi:hypothetical protein
MITFSSQLQQAYVPRRYTVIFAMYAFGMPRIACPTPEEAKRLPEEAKRLAEVICDIAKLAHRKKGKFILQSCGGKSIKMRLIPKIKKVESSAPTITFVNKDSYRLSFYDYLCNRCYYNQEQQEYPIYLDL